MERAEVAAKRYDLHKVSNKLIYTWVIIAAQRAPGNRFHGIGYWKCGSYEQWPRVWQYTELSCML